MELFEPLLSSAFLARLERLALTTNRRLAGLYPAGHRSLRYGTSLDFADYRQYHPGDDFRRIDYHLYARLGTLALKLFEAEDDITVRLLVDTSASMHQAKLAQAARVAAVFGWLALCHRDAVTLHTFADRTETPRRFRNQSAAPALFATLAALEPGGATQFLGAAGDVLSRPGPRGVTIVVSDLMTSDWSAAIDRLPARGSQVIVAHVLDRADIEPDLFGDVDLVDAETGRVVPVSLTADVQNAYRAAAREWIDEVAGRCRHVGATYMTVLADDDINDALIAPGLEASVLR
jgi:uncharacterized protein (DUF58 family)